MTIGVAVLGSTGSIGRSAIRVLSRQADRFRVVAITAYGSDELLSRQAVDAGAEYVGLVNGGDRKVSAALVSRNAGPTWSAGPQCLVEAATHPDVRIVMNAVVGAAGLEATPRRAPSRQAGRAGQQGTPGDGGGSRTGCGARGRWRGRAGRFRAQRCAAMRDGPAGDRSFAA